MTTKLTFGLLLSLGVATTAFAQTGRVGINTETPKTTFDVNGKKDGSGNLLTTDVTGMQAPRLTRAELTAKGDVLYGADQKGALVYITDVTAGDALTQRINITAAGYYYFDGTVWQKVANPSASTEPWFSKTTGTGATSNTEDIYQLGRVGIGVNTNTPPVDPFFTTFEPLLVPELIVKGKGRSGIAHYDTTTGAFNIGVGSIIENVPAAAGSNTFGFANQINNSPVTANNNAHSYTAEMVHNSAATQASVRNMDVNMTTAGAGKVNSADGILNSMSLSSTGGFDNVAGLRQNITSNATATGNSTGFYGINQNVNYSSPGTVGTLSGIRNSVNLNTTADITAPNFFGGVSGVNTSLNLNGSTAVPTGANVAGIRNNVFFSASGASAGTLFGINNNVFYNGTGTAALAVGTNSGTAKFAGAASTFGTAVGYTANVNSLNRSIGYLIGDPSGVSAAPSITTENATDPAYGFYVSTDAMYKVGGRQTWSFYSRDVNDRVFFAGNTAIGGTDLPTNKLHVTATANPLRLQGLQTGITPATDEILLTDASGVVKKGGTVAAVAKANEPWFSETTNTGATLNTENIYTMGDIGKGTNAPKAALHILTEPGVANDNIFIESYAPGDPDLIGIKSNGTKAAPTPLNGAESSMLLLSGATYGDGTLRVAARIALETDGAHTTTSQPSRINFRTTPTGSVGSFIGGTLRMSIIENGNVGIGTNNPTSKLQVVGLPTFADVATAQASGTITVGAFYRITTGTADEQSMVRVKY